MAMGRGASRRPARRSTPPLYRASKAALNMVTLLAASEFRETLIKFNAINPGHRQTDLAGIGVILPGASNT